MSERRWRNEHEIADHTGIPVSTLRSWRRKGSERVLPFHKIGALVRYDLDEVDSAIDDKRVSPQ